MKQRKLQVMLGLAMGTLVLLIAYVDLRQNSPGPISRVHAEVADLEGRSGCADCHGSWGQEMASACLDCHEPVQEHLDTQAGLHGHLDPIQAQACALCHSEHHGPEFALTNFKSFVLASATSPEDFDHSFIDFELNGAHTELSCVECHLLADAPLLAEGEQRYMGLSRSCASCHEDPHEGRMQRSCADCHNQDTFVDLFFVKHDEVLRLEGAHAGMDCRSCHAQDASHALELLPEGIEERTCASCHDSPHSPEFEHGNARLAGIEAERNCVACHLPLHLDFLEGGSALRAEQHAVSGFLLADPHAALECASCHGSAPEEYALRYPGRDALSCGACHEDPHAGQFELGAPGQAREFELMACVDCHARTEFLPHTFDAAMHAETALALTDSHAGAGCNACHKLPKPRAARQFRGTDLSCASCHGDVHDDVFEDHIQAEELGQHGQCALCHQPTSFQEVFGFDHGQRTDFAVRGAHAASGCGACHRSLPEADVLGRHFEAAPKGVGAKGCALCHADPHMGSFEGKGLPQEVNGENGCARCHVEHSFREFAVEFEHRLWTGFSLEGGHADLSCAECHRPLRKRDENGFTWQHAAGVSCGVCHDSPHAGQFQRDGNSDCAACHSNASSFAKLSFDHSIDTAFPLSDEHAGLACSACHETWIQGELSVVRYRGVESDCAACHGLQKDRLKGVK